MLNILELAKKIAEEIDKLPLSDKVDALNNVKLEIKKVSPFKTEPVDCVVWVKQDNVIANDYNPNSVAPPEMKLLETSIDQDGYTQPIVAWHRDGIHEVVDGFHRNRVGKESDNIPDEAPVVLENAKLAPSWRRMCKVLLRNDYWCKGLNFTQPRSKVYGEYLKIRDAKKKAIHKEAS